MAVLLSTNDDLAAWQSALAAELPSEKILCFPADIDDAAARATVEYACVWKHPAGDLARYPGLKAVLNLGAGVDSLLADPALPEVPIVRLHDPGMSRDIAGYVLHAVIDYHRNLTQYTDHQPRRVWQPLPSVAAGEFRVGILGMGHIGTVVADLLIRAGYTVAGWRRRASAPLEIAGGVVEMAAGEAGLAAMAARCDALVSVLPLTDATRAMLGTQVFGKLGGGLFVNVGRGAVIDDAALLDALDSGCVGNCVLDVFATEPLPPEHRYWQHPRVRLTPHISGETRVSSAARILGDNIRKLQRGELVTPLLDREAGY